MSHVDLCSHGAPPDGCFAYGCEHERQPHRITWDAYMASPRAAWQVAESGRDVIVSDGDKKRLVLGAHRKYGTSELFSDEVEKNLMALRSAARALVEALPKCCLCNRPATRAYGRGGQRWCDDHGAGGAFPDPVPEYPRAAPLRALLALLEKP